MSGIAKGSIKVVDPRKVDQRKAPIAQNKAAAQGSLAPTPSPAAGSSSGYSAGKAQNLRLESRPTPRFPMVVGGAVAAMVLTVVGAAALVKVDQIVTVPGTLRTLRSTQDVKPEEPGQVTTVLVKEGQLVQAGTPLVVLDSTVLRGQQQALTTQNRELGNSTAAEVIRLRGALAELEASETGLQSQIAINKQQLASLQALETQGAASRFQLLDYEKAIAQLESQRRQNLKQRVKLAAESSQKQAELAQQQAENRANRVATGEKLQRVVLRAPLTGTILNLKAKPAQVVAAGEVLLQLVPSDSLRAEAFMSNLDLAFVRPGQRADLSVASYDQNRYGTIGATVRTIGTDALPPDETYKFERFPVSLRLDRQYVQNEGKRYPLQAGMAIAVDLRLDKRTILDLLVSSMLNSTDSVRTIR
jgi:HlyD family secretion protein